MDGSFRKDRRPWPGEIARDVHEEIAAHIEMRREEYAARGLDAEEARAAAARKFGNRDDVAEACRLIDRRFHARERRRHMIGDLRQDLSYALRLFRRNPSFAAIAIVTLALGMGATTTIFTLANWALLRPVPGVTDPENVSVFWVGRRSSDRSFSPSRLSYPNLADVTSKLTTMSLGGYQGGGSVAVAGGNQAARTIPAEFVTASYFDVLGVRMQVGRPFTAAEDVPPSPLLGAVISDRLWESMFQRDRGVLQRTLDVAGVRFAILGVAAPAFHGTERLSTTDLWLPGASSPIVRHMRTLRYEARNTGGYYELVARLKPGATWTQAQAEMESLRAWLRDEYPKENAGFRESAFHLMGPIGPSPFARDLLKTTVGTAAWASALLLLIACANVGGLLTIRGIGRRSEFGVRKALGAGRSRLIRQQLAEGGLLWLAGGAAAVALVVLLLRTMNVAALLTPRPATSLTIDWRVLAFTAAVSLAVGVLFSIAPALSAARVEAAHTLRSSGPTATRRMFAGTSLAVFQLAASLTLLVGAGLLVATLRHLASVPLGFDPADVYVLSLRPATIGYSEAASLEYLEQFQSRLRASGGIRAVTAANGAPFFGGANMFWRVRPADAAPDVAAIETRSNALFSPSYFETLGIPFIRGRMFTEAEFAAARRGEARVAILNEALARRLFGTTDPIGRAVEFPRQGHDAERHEVIGLVASARYASLVTPPDEMIYQPAGRRSIGITLGATVIVRTTGSAALAEQARRTAADLNPSLPLTEVLSMSDAVGRSRRDWDLLARVVGIVAAVAAVLACIGLYAVVAHGVAQRRREFGIRVALGASRAEVWTLVLRRTAAITGAGLCFGLAGAYVFAQMLGARLVGVSPFDPALWALAALSLVAVATIASLPPARAATRVDVNETLRTL
jgi:predicted permease